jgi:hypothetical protein
LGREQSPTMTVHSKAVWGRARSFKVDGRIGLSLLGMTLLGLALLGSTLATPSFAAAAGAPPLDSITVQGKKEREKLQKDVDRFVSSAVMHYWDRPLLRWNTPVCPLVAGLPREQGEFILRRLSQIIRTAGAPLGPEMCKANFLVLVTSEPEELLEKLRKKKPGMFDLRDGMGTVKHFLRTERPVRVWYNWEYAGDGASAFAASATITGSSSPSGAVSGYPVLPSSNSRLSYSSGRSIDTAIIAVDIPRMKGVNLGQISDYVAMVGLAEINMDKEIDNAPSVLRLFSEAGGAPTEGMSSWDQALLRSLYGTRAEDGNQTSSMETQMLDSVAGHR